MKDNKVALTNSPSTFSGSAIVATTYFDSQSQPLDATETASASSFLPDISGPEAPAKILIETEANEIIMISTKQTKSFPWEKCPVEIRDMIFDEVEGQSGEYFTWRGSVPPLIIALRGLKQSYKQSLQRFQRENRAQLRMDSPWTGFEIGAMNCLELDTFKQASLLLYDPVEYPFSKGTSLNFVKDGFQRPEWFTTRFLRSKNLRKVYLSLSMIYNQSRIGMAHFIAEFPFWLGGFSRLTEVLVKIPILHQWIEGSRHRRIVNAILARILEQIGVQGQLISTSQPILGKSWELWEWKAPPGKTMDWPQYQGPIWKRPPFQQSRFPLPPLRDELSWNLFESSCEWLVMEEGQFYISGPSDEDVRY